jgi:ribosomal protein S17E
MTINNQIHPLHLSFILLFVITALFCAFIIIKILRNKKVPKLLSEEKYRSTLIGKMLEFSNKDISVFNIWPYVSQLKSAKILSHKIKERELIYKVYRNLTEDFEHILLATEKDNNYVVIVVDKIKNKIMGYHLLNQDGEYDLVA